MHHSGHQMTSIPVTISMLPPPLGITSKPEHVGCCVYYFNDRVQDCIDYRILVSMAKCTDYVQWAASTTELTEGCNLSKNVGTM